MKIGDVEYQGDKRKATFYYTADGRVDFRELIRHYAKEFRVKIEMRQIGARQESARIGGLGSCGRELCCSTWLTDFKSVTTAAARYQNLAINQSKLSGMCGRLKCCLNYELDTYLDALEQFPKNADKLQTKAGTAILIKTDIFKGLMYYAYQKESGRGKLYTLEASRVKEIKVMNKKGEKPTDLVSLQVIFEDDSEDIDMGFEDVTGVIELPEEKRSKKRRKKKRKPSRGGSSEQQGKNNNNSGGKTDNKTARTQKNKSGAPKKGGENKKPGEHKKPGENKKAGDNNRSRNRRRKGGRGRNNNNNNNNNKGDNNKS
ncbi:MAG: hypothetical protein HRU12_14210, partial [Phaeodactylibacter sp.]|nr:hypothetical protein [Phaeodactylibacter sp.]